MTLTITLRSGESYSFTVDHRPRHWKSWVMQQLPYDTDYLGCTFAAYGTDLQGHTYRVSR